MTVQLVLPNIAYRSRTITTRCGKVWRMLFAVVRKANVTPEQGDIALWVTHADSATIKLAMRSSGEDDEDPEWTSPPQFVMLIEGLCEALNEAGTPAKVKPIKEHFYAWANAAILDSFASLSVQRIYKAYNPDGKPFSIFVAKHDRSFSESELSVLWTDGGGPSPGRVKKKQSKARKGKKHKVVRKKRNRAS